MSDVARRVSMMDVARYAGVSQKTVSRAVNGERHVSQAVRERVRRAVEELGFRPNETARALVTRRTRRIGIVTTGTSLYGPASVLSGLERAARRAGYFVSVAHADAYDADEAKRSVEQLVSQGADGIAVSAPAGSVDPAEYVPTEIPLLRVEYPDGSRRKGTLVVGNDDVQGAREATEHLLNLGHRRVGHIAGPQGWPVTARRMQGWRAALRSAGVEQPEVRHGDWTPASGYRMAGKLLDLDVSALFVANDHMAIGAVHAVERSGLRVPRDVSIVGFDDIPEAAFLSTPLTTVRQDFDRIADEGMRRLVRAVHGEKVFRNKKIAAELVVRESAAPAP